MSTAERARFLIRPARSSRLSAALLTLALVAVFVVVAFGTPAAAETGAAPTSGTFTIDGHGNGHGHGLSQYGAKGAAAAGLGAADIIAFYYAHTVLASGPATLIRVALTDGNGDAQVQAKANMFLSWPGGAAALPTAGIFRWRLVPSGSSLTAQYLTTTWVTWMSGLPSLAYFSAVDGTVRLFAGSSATDYRGQIGATTSGGFTVLNRLDLDAYTQGVLPREMPSSWGMEAVRAQAIAARSYARYEVEHNASRPYDICDSDSCQVYGGMARYVGGNFAYGETDASNYAVTSTPNQVATYGGATIFAQFSSDDGGWTADGGQPYLVARPDPYDSASGSPWLNWTRTATVTAAAAQLGLAAVTGISVVSRDGNGDWGGRVQSAQFTGTDTSGHASSMTVTGSRAAAVLGLPHQWFHVRQTGMMGAIDTTAAYGRYGVQINGWVADLDHLDRSTQVAVYVTNGGAQQVTASLSRPDVGAYLGTGYTGFGYSIVAWLPPAGGTACLFAIDVDRVFNLALGCVSATPPSDAVGHVEKWGIDGQGHPTITGWAFDWDSDGGSTVARAYYGSSLVDAVASGSRPDVQSAFGLANAMVGFTVTLPAGDNHVCVWALNTVGSGNSSTLQCRYFIYGQWV